MDTRRHRRHHRFVEHAATLVENVLRYLVTHPAQLLLAGLLLVLVGAALTALVVPRAPAPPPITRTTVPTPSDRHHRCPAPTAAGRDVGCPGLVRPVSEALLGHRKGR